MLSPPPWAHPDKKHARPRARVRSRESLKQSLNFFIT
jgi:hypothetical protein